MELVDINGPSLSGDYDGVTIAGLGSPRRVILNLTGLVDITCTKQNGAFYRQRSGGQAAPDSVGMPKDVLPGCLPDHRTEISQCLDGGLTGLTGLTGLRY